MATSKMPKPILKKTSNPATANTTNATETGSSTRVLSKADRDRETALHHAKLLQARKEIELDILSSTEELLDFPTSSPPFEANNPSPEDAKAFKDLLKPFQPSDYDALIVERNISDDCGYALCRNKRLKVSGGKFRVLNTRGRARDMKIVESREVEKWCSEDCAKRALYIRVQLSECPAWEREVAAYFVKIDLLDEPKAPDITQWIGNLSLDGKESEDSKKGKTDLALERGDQGFASRNGLVDIKIMEKDVQRAAEAPSLEVDLSGKLTAMHLAVEGHAPRFDNRKQNTPGDDEDNNMDWVL